jgi:hypothetical protein
MALIIEGLNFQPEARTRLSENPEERREFARAIRRVLTAAEEAKSAGYLELKLKQNWHVPSSSHRRTSSSARHQDPPIPSRRLPPARSMSSSKTRCCAGF